MMTADLTKNAIPSMNLLNEEILDPCLNGCVKPRRSITLKLLRKLLKQMGEWLGTVLVVLLVLAFIAACMSMQVWACRDLHPDASIAGCLLSGGR